MYSIEVKLNNVLIIKSEPPLKDLINI